MNKRMKIIVFALLMAAASLYGGHLVRQARKQTQVSDTHRSLTHWRDNRWRRYRPSCQKTCNSS